ncbi:uncharacterized protein LDX57_009408 [Aspergillus melleus]|uniref:uncharacterized protein n=1 Tax=Aspergillus melleus TaxID=138277 RepID=UPI001E8D65BE|nr:uncharacterized protein LDX57_009408 [Aspergillus melleus]KAH8431756.1 hypothetical protein LDX57_009408 [Aspergillus melleus]
MDISDLSLTAPSRTPLLSTPSSSTPPTSPSDWRKIPYAIDIPVGNEDTAFHEIPEKAANGIDTHQSRKVDFLMAEFTRGFDPSTFRAELMAELPELVKNVLPGSYEQLLVILLEESNNVDKIQCKLREWLRKRYPQLIGASPIGTGTADESYFLTELQVLRKLLEPLRGEPKTPIYWMNTRSVYSASVCEQLEAAVRVIEEFKLDVLEALERDTEDRSCYSTLPVSNPRSSMMSMKEVRIEACKASLKWGGYAHAELELTKFYHFYRNDLINNRPEKAREEGWLPPTTTKIPRPSTKMADEGDLVVWPAHRGNEKFFNMLVKIALWLAMARGLAAVHLFCDVARLFTSHEPSKEANKAYINFLRRLTQIRANDGVRSNTDAPFSYSNSLMAKWNPGYFKDVQKVNRTLMASLTERPSLLDKKKEAPPFSPTPSSSKDGQAPLRIRPGSASWPRTAAAYVNRGSSAYEESTVAPHRVIPRSRSTTGFRDKTPWPSRHTDVPDTDEDLRNEQN